MRGIAYVVAAVAAVGIMLVIAKGPSTEPVVDIPTTTASADESNLETLTLNVPEMHCEFACFPKVKEALEKAAAVNEVQLAEQKEEGILDNRQVIVKCNAGFDIDEALALLAEAGYGETELVQ
ncbi:heavy-metal-associated domain-containing protein [bacterium]|nr:heavy-metal-associated domain-containing protein [bacterium]